MKEMLFKIAFLLQEMGTFTAFGNMSEMILPFSSASRENEPIVETVWKIFSHAHAACYNHFAEGFNDHHRFTSVLLPLFTNQINEIWYGDILINLLCMQ